jgi:major membrane immunogen (membrane-anchored lipoprotein)
MKKIFFIIGLVTIIGASTLLVSCDKMSCKCTYIRDGRTRIFREYPTNEDAKNCKDLSTILTAEQGTSVTCK